MRNYSALSAYLSTVAADTVDLSFAQVESIIGDTLPPSASVHPAWWSNEKSGSHRWAHLWQSAGWLSGKIDLTQRVVSFRRNVGSIDDVRESLYPTTLETVFDLVQLAGISTADWLTKADGTLVTGVKTNPNFCYNWSFGSPREHYALCIWHDTLAVRASHIVFADNYRELAQRLQSEVASSSADASYRRRALSQASRARAVDDALNVSYAGKLPVSVILTDGDRRNSDKLGEESSKVHARALDPVKWYVHEYNVGTGATLLVRGVAPTNAVPDGAESAGTETGPPDAVQQRAISIRRGQARFRETLLAAYGRTCAVTGCKIVDLLEAAHIRPHSDEPNYSVTNGLLLRTDIHTLFDLGLLSIDARLRVRLAPALLQSEYKAYDGKDLRQPGYPSEMPSSDGLERRFRTFKVQRNL